MKIRSMTATFGCLDEETLTLSDGLTLITRPNEGGKSTWAAFLLAMFYGIDTSQRAAKGRLPEKNRYQPWNGKAMSGTMELELDGKIIVLQRTSQRGKPMGVFRAYDKGTGLALPELTGENCGVTLLGVERAVFQRTAFLRGSELAVTEDQSLAQRLENLAATGTLEDSYPTAASRLKLWKNRLRYHQNGLIPETEANLQKVTGTLELMDDLRRQRLELTDQEERLQAHLKSQTAAAQAQWQAEQDALRQDPAPTEGPPPCPPALEGLTAEAILPTAQEALAAYRRLTKPSLMLLAPALLIAAGLFFQIWLPAILGAAVLGLLLLLIRKNKAAAGALLAAYGVSAKEDLLPAAMAWRDWLLRREQIDREAALRSRLAQQPWQPSEDLKALRDKAARFHREAESLRAREEALGSWEDLDAKVQKYQAQLADLRTREAALAMAQEALEQAHSQLEQVYAPQLTGLAGPCLQALTGNRYDGLILGRDWQLQIRETASQLTRPLAALSTGTQDQVWLALRLAMTDLLLPKEAPLILDDVFLTFDETRTAAALNTLANNGRQVLLFSCKKS